MRRSIQLAVTVRLVAAERLGGALTDDVAARAIPVRRDVPRRLRLRPLCTARANSSGDGPAFGGPRRKCEHARHDASGRREADPVHRQDVLVVHRVCRRGRALRGRAGGLPHVGLSVNPPLFFCPHDRRNGDQRAGAVRLVPVPEHFRGTERVRGVGRVWIRRRHQLSALPIVSHPDDSVDGGARALHSDGAGRHALS